MNERNPSILNIWTITEKPRDFPNCFVACRHEVSDGGHKPTKDLIVSTDIEALRSELMDRGLICIPRSSGDDPVIVESWI